MSFLFFLAALLSAVLAIVISILISLGGGASKFLESLTLKMGPGVVHKHSSPSYMVAYLIFSLAVVLFMSGIYCIGK